LLGINDEGVIAGYFGSGAQGHANKGYRLYLPYGQGNYAHENFPGFYAKSSSPGSSSADAFLALHNGRFITLAVPGASMTQAFGVNDRDEVVGPYTTGSGNNAATHGFT
jgi:hypothetical protein